MYPEPSDSAASRWVPWNKKVPAYMGAEEPRP